MAISNSRLKYISFFGGILYPFYFLPFIIQLIIRRQKTGYFLFSIFMGYLAYLMIPYDTMDIVRYYERFDFFKTLAFRDIAVVENQSSYFFDIYIWALASLGFSKEFLPFTVISCIYYIILFSYGKYCAFNSREIRVSGNDGKNNFRLVIVGLIFLFLHVRFIESASGLRNMLAWGIFLNGIVLYREYKSNYIFLFHAIASVLIHTSALLLLVVWFLSKFNFGKRFYYSILLFSVVLFLFGFGEKIFFTLIDKLEPFLKEMGLYFHSYFDADGVWGAGFYNDKNIKTIIFEKYIKPICFYFSVFYLLVFKIDFYKREVRFLILLSILILVCSVSRTIFDRLIIFHITLFIFYLTGEILGKRITNFKKAYLFVFFILLVLTNLGFVYKYRDLYVLSWLHVFYMPMPFGLLNSIEPSQYIIRSN